MQTRGRALGTEYASLHSLHVLVLYRMFLKAVSLRSPSLPSLPPTSHPSRSHSVISQSLNLIHLSAQARQATRMSPNCPLCWRTQAHMIRMKANAISKYIKKMQPAMEFIKATRNRNVGIRPFNATCARQLWRRAWKLEVIGQVAFIFSTFINTRARHVHPHVDH